MVRQLIPLVVECKTAAQCDVVAFQLTQTTAIAVYVTIAVLIGLILLSAYRRYYERNSNGL